MYFYDKWELKDVHNILETGLYLIYKIQTNIKGREKERNR